MAIEIKKLTATEIDTFIGLIRLFEDVFEMNDLKMPDKAHLEQQLQSDSFLVFVALQDDKVVGGLTAYVMQQYYSTAPLVYIYDLAIDTKWQRKGIGRMLINDINRHCKSIGAEAVMVEAEEEDGHAIEFYRSTGAKGIKTVHFDYLL